MAKRNTFLQQLERRRQTHLKNAPSHVDKPSEQTIEELEAETKRAELEKTKAETAYWQGKQAKVVGDDLEFALASNNERRRRFTLPKCSRPSWK